MKLLKITLLFCLLTTLLSTNTYGNNVAAGELSYTWLSGNTYRFVYKGYFDCAGSPAPASVYLCATNTCANTNTHYILNKWTGSITYGMPNGSNVPVGCLKPPTQCDTHTSTLNGYKEYWYTTDITLNDTCSNWQFVTTVNSRTNFDNVVAGNQYLKVTFDNTNIQKNSSPYFRIPAIIYPPKHGNISLKNPLFDPDGDSLVLDVVQPLTHSGTTNLCPTVPSPVVLKPHNPPISFPNNPFPSRWAYSHYTDTLNNIFIQPDSNGVFLVTYNVKEYRNGQLIGTMLKDVTFVIANVYSGIGTELDTASLKGLQHFNPGTYISCPGDTIRMCYRFSNVDSNARIYGFDTLGKLMPGASVSYSGQGTDTVHACMEWIPSNSDTGIFLVRLMAVDSTCYPPGLNYKAVGFTRIYVRGRPLVSISKQSPNPAWPYVSINFGASHTPCNSPWYQWQVNGKDVPGTQAQKYLWSSTKLNDGDHVRCLFKCYDTLCMDTTTVTSNTTTINMTTTVAKTELHNNLAIFPNPNNGVFTISAPATNGNIPWYIAIFNIYGQLVYSTDNYTGRQIDISGVPPGVYMLKLSDGENNYMVNFIVR